MLLNFEQIIGYFAFSNNFDAELTNERNNYSDMYSNFDKFFGNELKLFDDLHIASVINNDTIYVYNVSNILFSGERAQDQCRAANIKSLLNINLPFSPNCNCSLFFDRCTSILTISVSSNEGQLYIIEISVFGGCEYSFTILTTRSFKTELSNLKLLTQATKSLFLACNELGVFGIISNSAILKNELLPLFIKKNIFTESLEISAFQILKTTVIDKNTENIYLITFSEKNKELCLILIRFNPAENNFYSSIIDRRSDIEIGINKVTNPVISLLEGTDHFVLLINSTVYLYKILNFCDYNFENINLQLSSYLKLDFQQSGDKKKLSYPQVYCNKSEIYIARATFSENITNYYDICLPICEIHKIYLNDSASDNFPSNALLGNSTLVWSHGLQNSFNNTLDISDLKCKLISSIEKLSNFEEIVNFLFSRVIGECPSKTVVSMAYNRYLRFLEGIISKIVDKEKHCELLNILYSTSKFKDLVNLMKNVYIYLDGKVLINNEFETSVKCKYDIEKIIFLITPFHILINYFKNIGNYCIRIFSDKDKTFLLSPISVSVISSLSRQELNKSSSIFENCNSYLNISLEIIRNYLKLKYLVFRIIFYANKIKLEKYLFDLFNFYISNGINNKIIVCALIMELIEAFYKKLTLINKFEDTDNHYTSLNEIFSPASNHINNFSLIYYDILTQNFTTDELKSLIQNIIQFFTNLSSISNDEVLNFIGKSIKVDHTRDVECFLLFSVDKKTNKYIKASNFEIMKVKNIILILNFCSIITRNIFKYFSWKNLIRNINSAHSCTVEHILQFFSEDYSFLNLGKYMVAGKLNIIARNCERSNEYHFIPSFDQVYRVYLYYNSIYKFFSSDVFINSGANDLSSYIFSNKIFWEPFLNDFCSKRVSQECNFQLVDLVYDYLEQQIINGCFEHNYLRYISYIIRLLPYKNHTSDLSLSILKQLISDIKLVDEIIELIKPKEDQNQKNLLEGFSCNKIKVIYLISLIFRFFDNPRIKIYHNSVYFNLLEISINLICACFSSCSPDQKIIINEIHKKYLIQYIYLSKNNIEDHSVVKLLNKSLSCFNSKHEKMLFLMVLWIKHYLSSKVENESELRFSTISKSIFATELEELYSLLINMFWKKARFLKDTNSEAFLGFYSKNAFVTRSIYKFLMNEWKRGERYQEIVTFAYLNALDKYCDSFSYNNCTNILFPESWIEFILRNNSLDEEFDSFKIINEALENLSGIIQYFSSEKEVINMDSEPLNIIISSLSTYITYSSTKLFNQFNNRQYSDKPICIPSNFFGIELPKTIYQNNYSQEIHHKVTFLPSIEYISCLKWYFVGINKLLTSNLTLAETYQNFINFCKNIERYKNYLESNGIYFKQILNPHLFCSKNLASLLNISIVDLNYYLIINGYFETSYRLTQVADKFINNFLRDYSSNLSNNRWITFSNPLTQFIPNNIYKTIGFWIFTYSFFLSYNTIYFNSLVEYKNDFTTHISGQKKKKLSYSSPDLKITVFEEILLQNAKLRNMQLLKGSDNLAFGININYWSSIINRINHSPYFLQGVHIALLVNERIYGAMDGDNSSDSTSILPIQLSKIYKDPEYLLKIIRNCSTSIDQHTHILINVIENLLSFSFIDEALRLITAIISDKQIKLPIYLIAKVRYLIKSSNNVNIKALSEKFESMIHKSIFIDALA
ncbi:hypothetical protein CmeUKMEL1_12800 [Cryptosporidium meleagridis]|uniref:Uncharacterized protein n=1 Tax=Cryptosporidium meleagridis TaxID=93969 RepID=A0A2P4Z3G6_9CRYT|nr:hypothetical protein CmeUKMEL1_12800 [Cryptosporidium meleagridis]